MRSLRFVLVEPQRGGNVGQVSRAMANLGVDDLRLVRPACDPLGEEARRMAVSSVALLERAPVHATLDEALAGAQTVVGTSARRGKQRSPHWSIEEFRDEVLAGGEAGSVAVVFGREDHGLSDADLDRCTHLVYLPAAGELTSFNLAQAVLLVGWELRRRTLPGAPEERPLAADAEREAYYEHLERALHAIGFVTPQTAESIMRRMRRIYGRAALSPEELATLRGLARQMEWAGRRAERS